MPAIESEKVVVEGYLNQRPGYGWVVDVAKGLRGTDERVRDRVWLGSVVMKRYSGKWVRITIEAIERMDSDGG